jgi:hypothetical protein
VEQIRQDTIGDHEKRVTDVMKELTSRIHSTLKGLKEDLEEGEKGCWRQASINNVIKLGNLIPKLNLTGDSTLNAIAKAMSDEFRGLDERTLKDNRSLSDRTKKRIESLLSGLPTDLEQQQQTDSGLIVLPSAVITAAAVTPAVTEKVTITVKKAEKEVVTEKPAGERKPSLAERIAAAQADW